jgi:hypothetical protein
MATSRGIRDPAYLANFDSATAMLKGVSACLHGRDFPMLGTLPKWLGPAVRPLVGVVNKAPLRLQQRIYALSGGNEAVATDKLTSADVGRIAQWVVAWYPQQRYPAVAIGSSKGALVH